MNFKETITYIETDTEGKIIFIGGSCKAKDLRRKE